MLIIKFEGQIAEDSCFEYSVVNDNKSDILKLILDSTQYQKYTPYLKLANLSGEYIDKVKLDDGVVDSENDTITFEYALTRKSTKYKNLKVQLQLQDNENDIVWQTQIVQLHLFNTIPADEEISEDYPTELQQLETEVESFSGDIEELKVNVGKAGYSLLMSIDSNYDLVIQLLDKNNNVISQQDVDLPLEQMIVDVRYDSTLKEIILTLDNGQQIEVPIGDLVSGLVSNDELEQALSNYALKEQAFNVIETIGSVLTQEQYDLITNGKPTLIKNDNRFLFAGAFSINGVNYVGASLTNLATSGGGVATFQPYRIEVATKSITFVNCRFQINQAANGIALPDQVSIKGKTLPSNPSSTGTFGFKSIDGTLSWQQEWYGTQAEYDALGTYDNNTIYNIIEE